MTTATTKTATESEPTTRPAALAAAANQSEVLLIDIENLSVLLHRSEASLERDQSAGRLPAPVYVGGSRRWRRAEIVAWVAAGCPVRARWDEIRAAGGAVA
jgi:predicted DNA-binding transcriptional regulator AlpA